MGYPTIVTSDYFPLARLSWSWALKVAIPVQSVRLQFGRASKMSLAREFPWGLPSSDHHSSETTFVLLARRAEAGFGKLRSRREIAALGNPSTYNPLEMDSKPIWGFRRKAYGCMCLNVYCVACCWYSGQGLMPSRCYIPPVFCVMVALDKNQDLWW